MILLGEILLSYIAVYCVIWMHEVGHAYFYWKYGCKKNFLKVTVKPYLFFSTPAPIEGERLYLLTQKQHLIIGYAGIIMNVLSAVITFMIVCWIPMYNQWILLFLWQFLTLHLAEAISYLVLGNIYLVSDMLGIAQINPKLRPINFIVGVILTIIYIAILSKVPEALTIIVILYNIVTIVCMGGGRIIFTYLYKKRQKNA